MSEYIIDEDDLKLCERCADRLAKSIERYGCQEVIRCADCKWYADDKTEKSNRGTGYCHIHRGLFYLDDFCSYADPK